MFIPFHLDDLGKNKNKTKPSRKRRLTLETLEQRQMLSVAPWSLSNTEDSQIILLDYQGAPNVTFDGPALLENLSVAPLNLPDGSAADDFMADVCESLNTLYGDWPVQFVLAPPSAGDYSTIYVGGTNEVFLQYGNFLGIAESVDVGNLNPNDKAFVFSETIAELTTPEFYQEKLVGIIAHEAGHLIGLSHSSDALGGIMAGGRSDDGDSEWGEIAFSLTTLWGEIVDTVTEYGQVCSLVNKLFDSTDTYSLEQRYVDWHNAFQRYSPSVIESVLRNGAYLQFFWGTGFDYLVPSAFLNHYMDGSGETLYISNSSGAYSNVTASINNSVINSILDSSQYKKVDTDTKLLMSQFFSQIESVSVGEEFTVQTAKWNFREEWSATTNPLFWVFAGMNGDASATFKLNNITPLPDKTTSEAEVYLYSGAITYKQSDLYDFNYDRARTVPFRLAAEYGLAGTYKTYVTLEDQTFTFEVTKRKDSASSIQPNVVLLFDTSGSMGDDVATMKREALSMVQKWKSIYSDLTVGVAFYSEDQYHVVLRPSSDINSINAAINSWQSTGGSGEIIYTALLNAMDMLPQMCSYKGTSQIIVFTDEGSDPDNPAKEANPEEVFAKAAERGVIISFGSDTMESSSDLATIKEIAGRTGGQILSTRDGSGFADNATDILLTNTGVIRASGTTSANLSGSSSSADTVTFDASLSYSVKGPIIRYEWDFDDDGVWDYVSTSSSAAALPAGIAAAAAFSPIVTHIYEYGYNGDAVLRITDDTGLRSTTRIPVSVICVVNTTSDVVNASDGVVSLREAILYAKPDTTITFDDLLKGKTIYVNSNITINNDVTINGTGQNITIAGNGATYVFNVYAENVTIFGLTIAGGRERGIYYSKSGGTLNLIDTVIMNNGGINDYYYSGAGIYFSGKTMNLISSTVSGNNAGSYSGGGIYMSGGTLYMSASTIAGNSASSGGGIYGSSYTMHIDNSLIAGNKATGYGGGIYYSGASSSTVSTITNTTIVGNTASRGGGIYNYYYGINLVNSIIADNIAPDSPDVFVYNSSSDKMDAYYSLIGNTATSGKAVANVDNTSKFNVDPKFVKFTSYTTWTKDLWKSWDLRLLETSPARDSGSNSFITNIFDLDGQYRVYNDRVDMGTYEYSSITLITPLDAPRNITATDKHTTTPRLTITWTPVQNANGYFIQYATDPNFNQIVGTPQYVDGGTTSSADSTVTLTAGIRYYVRVMTVGSGNYTNSEYSTETVSAIPTETTITTPPTAPTGFQSTNRTTDSITLFWTAQPGLTGYTLEYCVSGTSNWAPCTPAPGATATTATITNLTPGTTYDFRLTAINAGGTAFSTTTATTLNSVVPPIVTPAGYSANDWAKYSVAVAVNGLTASQVTWAKVNGEMRIIEIFADDASLRGTLDFSGCTALQYLKCSDNQLTSLNVSGCSALRWLYCYRNELTALNVSGCKALAYFECGTNRLTTLKVSDCAALLILYCEDNELTELDVSCLKALEYLRCHDNQLTSLKISGCKALECIICHNNRLTFSTLASVGPYGQQANILIAASLASDVTLDLSKEYNIDGTLTTYKWFYANGTPVVGYEEANGTFKFSGLSDGSVIYCVMTNEKFPKLTLKTTEVTISAPTTQPAAPAVFVAITPVEISSSASAAVPAEAMSMVSSASATPSPSTTLNIHEWQRFWCELWVESKFTGQTEIVLAYDANLFVPTVMGGSVKYEAPAGVTLTFGDAILNAQTGLTEWVITVGIGAGFVWPAGSAYLGEIAFTPAVETTYGVKPGVPASEIYRDAAVREWLTVNGENVLTNVWAVPYDLNDDGKVDINDLILFISDYGKSATRGGPLAANFTGVGSVDITDLVHFIQHYGMSVHSTDTMTIPRLSASTQTAATASLDMIPPEFAAMFGMSVAADVPAAESSPETLVEEVTEMQPETALPSDAPPAALPVNMIEEQADATNEYVTPNDETAVIYVAADVVSEAEPVAVEKAAVHAPAMPSAVLPEV